MRGNRWLRLPSDVIAFLLVGFAGVAVTLFFLAPYMRWGYRMPFGFDVARYLDQTTLVAKYGLSRALDLHLPPPSRLLGGRAGFFATVLPLSRLFGTDTFKLAAVVPAVAAAAIALAAGALASLRGRRSPWELAVVGIVVGTSGALVRLMGGTYTDNLIAGAVLVAAFVPIVLFLVTGRGLLAAVVLLAAGAVTHPQFLAIVIAVIAFVALVSLPSSVRAWRSGDQHLMATPTARLGTVIGLTVLLGAVLLIPLLAGGTTRAVLPGHRAAVQRFREDLVLYRLWLTIPLAVVGAAALGVEAFGRRRRRATAPPNGSALKPSTPDVRAVPSRFILLASSAWIGLTLLVIAGLYLGRRWPAHRFMAFLLPFPILVGMGLFWVGIRVSAWSSLIVGTVIVMAGMGTLAFLGYRGGSSTWVEYLDADKIREPSAARIYLDEMHVSEHQPIVFIITDIGPNPRAFIAFEEHAIRAVLDPGRIPYAYFYVGSPENYLLRRPTILPGDTRSFNAISTRSWETVRTILARRPIAFLLSSYYSPEFPRFADEHPDWLVAERVMVVEGLRNGQVRPLPRHYASAPFGIRQNVLFGVGTLLALTIIGLGWAVALLPQGVESYVRLALGPALGLAMLLIVATSLDAAGLRLGGLGGVLAGPVAGGLGWIAASTRIIAAKTRSR